MTRFWLLPSFELQTDGPGRIGRKLGVWDCGLSALRVWPGCNHIQKQPDSLACWPERSPDAPSPGHAQFPLVPSGRQLAGKPARGSLWPVKVGRARAAGDPAESLRLGTSGVLLLLRACVLGVREGSES